MYDAERLELATMGDRVHRAVNKRLSRPLLFFALDVASVSLCILRAYLSRLNLDVIPEDRLHSIVERVIVAAVRHRFKFWFVDWYRANRGFASIPGLI